MKLTEEQVKELEKLGISLEKQDTIQEFIEELNKLEGIGVDVSKIVLSDTIETLAKKSEISKEKIEEIGLISKEKIGNKLINIRSVYRGKAQGKKPTEEQVEELIELGISLEKQERDTIQGFIDTLNQLEGIRVKVEKIKWKDTIETLAQKSGVSIEQIEEIGLNPKEKIGIKLENIKSAHRGKGRGKRPTEEQVEELTKMGINLEKQARDSNQEFIDKLKVLKGIGVDVSKLNRRYTIEELVQKSGVSIEQIEKIGLNSEEKIGIKLSTIRQAYRGKGCGKRPTEEQVKEITEMGITLEPTKITKKEIAQASIESLTNIEMADAEDIALKELAQKEKTTDKAK